MYHALSTHVRFCPSAVDSALERLTCVSQGITEVDIHPTVLAVLTNPAKQAVPSSVTASVAQRHEDAFAGACGQLGDKREAQGGKDAQHGFNTAIAFSLHTVLLTRNCLRDILGIIQFKNVVRLSLLGNRIDTIEACEPLSLLPQLAFLSLEFNPVTTLPHYQAHLLRICSWPKPLSTRSCRLKKLDAMAVTTDLVERGVRCLLREASLLPELSQRVRLVCFLSHVAHQQRVVAEMRHRGVLLQSASHTAVDTSAQPLDTLLARCGGAAIRALDSSSAAHLCRIVARDHQRALRHHRHRRGRSSEARRTGACSPCGSDSEDSIERAQWSSITSLLLSGANDDDNDTECENEAAGASPDRASEVLADVSDILLSKDLSASTSYLRNAHEQHEATVCEEWSMDWFRVTLSSLDVHVCRLLLRLARSMGQTIDSQDVDRLLRKWLTLLSETAETHLEDVNITGRRRQRTPTRPHATQPVAVRKPKSSACPSAHLATASANTSILSSITANTSLCAPQESPLSGETDISSTPTHAPRCEPSVRTTPSTLVLDVDEDDEDDIESLTTAACTPDGSSHDAVSCAEEPTRAPSSVTTTTTTRTEVEPRGCAPVAVPPSSSSPLGKPPLPPTCASVPRNGAAEDDASSQSTVATQQFQLDHWKRAAWQQWRSRLQERALNRRCDAFIRARVADTFAVGPGSAVLHALLPRMPYTERKRCFFDHWRMRYEEQQVERLLRLQARFSQWRRRLLRQRDLRDADSIARCARLTAAFGVWKEQVVPRRLVLPTTATDRTPQSELSRVLTAPLSESGAHLVSRPADNTTSSGDETSRVQPLTPLDHALKAGYHRQAKVILSPERLDTEAEAALFGPPGLSPSHPMSDNAPSPSPYLMSPMTSRQLWGSHASACRYASSADDCSPCVRVSLARHGEQQQQQPQPTLTPPPPLARLPHSRLSSVPSPSPSPSALRWSNAGLTRSVPPVVHHHGETRSIFAPTDLLLSQLPTLSGALFGGPYPARDVEALVQKAEQLRNDRQALTAALQLASETLLEVQRDCAAATGQASHYAAAFEAAQQRVSSLQERVGVLASEVDVLERLISTLRRKRRDWLESEVETARSSEPDTEGVTYC